MRQFVFKLKELRRKPALLNTSKLLSASFGSQIIGFVSAPILTRIYSPESFGLFASYMSVLGILSVISSLRYEFAIVIPESEKESEHIIRTCLLLIFILSCSIFASSFFIGYVPVSAELKSIGNTGMIQILSLATLFSGFINILNYVNIRVERFGLLGVNNFAQSLLIASFTISLSYFYKYYGQVIGNVLALMICASVYLVKTVNINKIIKFSNLRRRQLAEVITDFIFYLKKYSYIAIPNFTAAALSSSFNLIVSISMVYFGDIRQLGYYYLAEKLVNVPTLLVGKPIGDVFLSKLSKIEKQEVLGLCIKNVKTLIALLSPVLLLYSLLLYTLGPFIFGHFWSNYCSLYILYLIPSSVASVALNSTGMAFVTENLNNQGLFAHLGMLILRLSPLIVALHAKVNGNQLPLIFSIGLFIGYIFYGSVLFRHLILQHRNLKKDFLIS